MSDSPYLSSPDRLGDVIAAIQVMGTYKFYKLDFAGWADRIVGDERQAQHWRRVVEEHPEFFRMDSKREKASLVWRRQRQKLFNVDTGCQISREKFGQLGDDQKLRISRMPLASTELALLLDAAIKLHSTALEHKKDRRWWVPIIASLAGVILGGALTALFARSTLKSTEQATSPTPSPTLSSQSALPH
jgi:hypothetical protein